MGRVIAEKMAAWEFLIAFIVLQKHQLEQLPTCENNFIREKDSR